MNSAASDPALIGIDWGTSSLRAFLIGTKGEVVPCCLAGVPFFGNLLEQPFHEIWNGDTYQTYRRHVFTDSPHGPCRNCYLIYPNLEGIEEEGYLKY